MVAAPRVTFKPKFNILVARVVPYGEKRERLITKIMLLMWHLESLLQLCREVLREMGRRSRVPILTKPAHARDLPPEARGLFALEDRCTSLYGLCFPEPWTGAHEWTTSPVFLP